MIHSEHEEYSPASAMADATAFLKLGQSGLIGATYMTKSHIEHLGVLKLRAQTRKSLDDIVQEYSVLMDSRGTHEKQEILAKLREFRNRVEALRPDNALLGSVASFRRVLESTTKALTEEK
jgi:Flp pilus assembly CpaF family ATPase